MSLSLLDLLVFDGNLGKFLVITASNISSVPLSLFLHLIVFPLYVCYTFYIFKNSLFCFFSSFKLWKFLFSYSQTQRFFPRSYPIY